MHLNFQLSVSLYRKEKITSVNINSNNFTVYFKKDIVVKLNP